MVLVNGAAITAKNAWNKTNNTEVPITIEVVYRPPSGNINSFNDEFEYLLSQPPNKMFICAVTLT